MTTDSSTTPGTTDRAKETASTAADQGRHIAGTAKEETMNVAGAAAEQARNVLGDAMREMSDQVSDQATTQRDRLSETLRTLGDDLEQMASQAPGSGLAVDLAREVSERARSLGSQLEGREPGQLLDDARGFARRRPGTFLLGALAAGVVAGRLFRATADGAAAATLAQDSPTGLDSDLGNNLGSGLDGGFSGTGTAVPVIAEPDPYLSGYPTPETGSAPVMDPTVPVTPVTPVTPVSPVSGRPTLDTP